MRLLIDGRNARIDHDQTLNPLRRQFGRQYSAHGPETVRDQGEGSKAAGGRHGENLPTILRPAIGLPTVAIAHPG